MYGTLVEMVRQNQDKTKNEGIEIMCVNVGAGAGR